MHRASLAASILLLGCPADDAWEESLEDGTASSTGGSASASATASASASASATATGSTSMDTGTATTTDTTTTAGTTTATETASSTDASTGADSTTGTAECDPGLEPAEITEVDGCDAPVGEPFCSEGQEHVAQDSVVEWQSDPPHSGPHYPTWETWDEHAEVVPRGNWVHNLEHGGIVLTYRCNDDCEPELEILRDVIAQRPELRILLTPDPLLPGDDRFAATAWTWIHRFDAPDLDTLLCFADQHENHAPEDVP